MTPEMTRRTMDEIIWPTVRGMAARGTPFKGVLFAGLMITAERPQADRVQRALRRSRDAGADDAPQVGPAAGAGRHRRRRAQDLRPALARRCGADRGDGREGLSRQLRQGHADRRARRRARGARASRCSTPARPAKATSCAPSADACSTSRRAAGRVGEAQRAAYEAVGQDRLAGRLLPQRHRLARHRPGAPHGAESMSALPDLFPGFEARRVDTAGGSIFLRTGGSGPPLLLLHGYPQTHVCWHKMARRAGAAVHAGDPRSARLRRQLRAARRCRAHRLLQAGDGRRTASP